MTSDVGVCNAVWTYWEDKPGRTRSSYLGLCLESIRRHAGPLEVRVVDRGDAQIWLPDLDLDCWESLPAANYRSDYLRSRVLQRYGGVWMDMDTVALRPLSELLDEIDDTGIVCFGRELGRFFGGMCAARPGSPFVDAWAEEQHKVLSRHGDWSMLGYAALAQDVTWDLARRYPWKNLPLERAAPIPWYQWRRFMSRTESPRRILAGSPLTIVLWNAVMAPSLRRYDRRQLLSSRILLARLLRIALGISELRDEDDAWTKLQAFSSLRFGEFGQRVESTTRRLLSGSGSR